MPTHVLTFRPQLQERITALLDAAAMSCVHTGEALLDLVVSLADYREEDRRLFPTVLVCDDLRQVLRIVQGSSFLPVGRGPRGSVTAALALKRCAPLAAGGWGIGIDRQDNEFEYGVFRQPAAPLAVDLRTTILDLQPGEARAVLVSQVAPSTVEVVANGCPPLEVHFSAEPESVAPTREALEVLPRWLVEGIHDDGLRRLALSYWSTVLAECLRAGHGALIAVLNSGDELPAALAGDAVRVPDAPRLVDLLNEHKVAGTSEALYELLAFQPLFSGMLASDGIVVMNTIGNVLAFNCFVHADQIPNTVRGGARTRAFNALCQLVDSGLLRGAFIRSTDGKAQLYEGGSQNVG